MPRDAGVDFECVTGTFQWELKEPGGWHGL